MTLGTGGLHSLEDAIRILGELPDDQKVYFTGTQESLLRHLEKEFQRSGLIDVVFIPIADILRGRLRELKGVLIIDDVHTVSYSEKDQLLSEQRVMNRGYLERRTKTI
jgi:hypothetical protein